MTARQQHDVASRLTKLSASGLRKWPDRLTEGRTDLGTGRELTAGQARAQPPRKTTPGGRCRLLVHQAAAAAALPNWSTVITVRSTGWCGGDVARRQRDIVRAFLKLWRDPSQVREPEPSRLAHARGLNAVIDRCAGLPTDIDAAVEYRPARGPTSWTVRSCALVDRASPHCRTGSAACPCLFRGLSISSGGGHGGQRRA